MGNTIEASIRQLRNNLSSLVEQAYYTNAQIRLTRHNKPFVRIVSENFMQNLDSLLEKDIGLRETLEIMADENILEMLSASQKDIQNGQARPLTELLKK